MKYYFIYAFFWWPLFVRIIGCWNSFHLRILLLTSLWIARVLPIIERTTKPEKKFHTKLQIIHLHLFLGGRGCKKLGKMVDLLLVCEMGSKKERQTSGILRGSCPRLGDILTGQILNGQRSSARNRCRPSVNMDKHKIVYLQRFGICLLICGWNPQWLSLYNLPEDRFLWGSGSRTQAPLPPPTMSRCTLVQKISFNLTGK